MNFVHTLEAVRQADGDQWRIGDALAKDLAPFVKSKNGHQPVKSARARGKGARALSPIHVPQEQFAQCRQQLADHGYKYEIRTLRDLLTTALNFPKETRTTVPWSVHCEARNPIALKRLLSLLREAKRKPTQDNVKSVMIEWRRRYAEERGKRMEQAKAKEAAATEEIKDAQQRMIGTKDKEERAKADADCKAAKQKRADARAERVKAATAPPFDPTIRALPPAPSQLEGLATEMVMEPNAKRLLTKIRDNRKELEQYKEFIPQDTAASLITLHAKMIDECQEIIEMLGGGKKPKTHLQVIESGADSTLH